MYIGAGLVELVAVTPLPGRNCFYQRRHVAGRRLGPLPRRRQPIGDLCHSLLDAGERHGLRPGVWICQQETTDYLSEHGFSKAAEGVREIARC